MQPNEYSSGVSPVCGEATVRKSDRHGRGRRSPVGSVSRPVCVLPSPGLASRITHFFIFQQQQWCVSISGCRRTDPDMLGTTRRSEDNIDWRCWRWSGCPLANKEARRIFGGGRPLSRRGPVRPEPVKASSFALGWLMTLATPTRAGYAGNCVPWPHARPRVSRDRSRHGGMPCYVTMVTTCHLTNGF